MQIRVDDLQGAAIQALLQQHLAAMHEHSPPESVHALDLQSLRDPSITFWTAWEDNDLLGCGALRQLDDGHAELKSMRTASTHLRKGVGRAILQHILGEARQRGIRRISLETGTPAPFAAARRLYASEGFVLCEPFADYALDPYSVFLTKVLV